MELLFGTVEGEWNKTKRTVLDQIFIFVMLLCQNIYRYVIRFQ